MPSRRPGRPPGPACSCRSIPRAAASPHMRGVRAPRAAPGRWRGDGGSPVGSWERAKGAGGVTILGLSRGRGRRCSSSRGEGPPSLPTPGSPCLSLKLARLRRPADDDKPVWAMPRSFPGLGAARRAGGVLNHQWGAGFAFECGAGWGALWEAGLRRAISDVHRQGPFGLAAIAATRRRSLPLPPAAARCHATRRCLMLCLPTTAINRQGIIWCSWIACHEQNPACSYSTTRPRRCAPVWTAAELGPPRSPGGNDPIPGLTHCCTPGLCACRVKDKQFGNTNLGVMPVPYVRGTAASREQQPVIQPHCSASAADSAG